VYHTTRLLAEFGVKWTPLVAQVGAQPLFMAYFGMNSTCLLSKQPNQMSFYTHITINILLICCLLMLDVETQVWRGVGF